MAYLQECSKKHEDSEKLYVMRCKKIDQEKNIGQN